jgi:two-component system chemotaxis response regulator CheB
VYGPAAIGVVLSGALFDGASGLLALNARGGLAIVQDPNDASVDAMPQNALKLIEADFVIPAADIGPLLGRLVDQTVEEEDSAMADGDEQIRQTIREDIQELGSDLRAEELTIYTCPDCGGSMWQSQDGAGARFVCHVGHAYGPEILFGQKADELGGALWACVRLFTEKSTLARQVAARSKLIGDTATAERVLEQAETDARRAQLIQEMLTATPQAAD